MARTRPTNMITISVFKTATMSKSTYQTRLVFSRPLYESLELEDVTCIMVKASPKLLTLIPNPRDGIGYSVAGYHDNQSPKLVCTLDTNVLEGLGVHKISVIPEVDDERILLRIG